MTIEEGAKDMEREIEINKFMKEVVRFLEKNKCKGIHRNIENYYVSIEFKAIKS